MPVVGRTKESKLPRRFTDLVQILPPRAIMDEQDHEATLEMIDRLMASGRLTREQAVYMETLVQLVQVYEAEHHAIDTSDISGIDSLKHLMEHGCPVQKVV